MTVTEIAIKRPLLIIVVFATLIIFGILGYSKLNYNLLPKFKHRLSLSKPYIKYPRMKCKKQRYQKIEDAVSSIEGRYYLLLFTRKYICCNYTAKTKS